MSGAWAAATLATTGARAYAGCFGFRSPHRARAAVRAISERRSGVSFAVRAAAPILAPFRPIRLKYRETAGSTFRFVTFPLFRLFSYSSAGRALLQASS